MKIRDYMTATPITANLRDGLRQTWDRMHERGVRHMPVLDGEGSLVGIVSDRDLRRPESLDEPNITHLYALDKNSKVQDAMTPNPTTVGQDDELDVALDLFIDRRFGALPVVGDGGQLAGMLSTLDLLRACRDLHTA